ncbi:hypothetical protein [Cupriavidus sp. UYPR2.512]|uniref:hypothetical protein n=1 Tax=Cupriavidus sp. UYPR2.512 TaxID=1080187 RepID=UPI00035FF86B|nr:hypothetical protein [Cupriavidus sp. UYPR2.512]UIF88148.1 hypothetical protein KAF44_19885 [Cupriavidus necator]
MEVLASSDTQALIEIEHLSHRVPMALHAAWLRAAGSGQTALGYDEWLEGRLRTSPEVEHRYRQGLAVFALRHRGCYRIDDPVLGRRYFRCLLDGQYPFVSFFGTEGHYLPWLTLPGLFTADALVSLQRLKS